MNYPMPSKIILAALDFGFSVTGKSRSKKSRLYNITEVKKMEIKPIKRERLFRDYEVSIPYNSIQSKVDEVIAQKAENFKMAGFREGKVPISLVKRQIGAEVLKEELKKSVDEAVRSIIKESGERPAMTPEVDVKSFKEGSNLEIAVRFEALPIIPAIDFSKISLDGYEIEVSAEDTNKARAEIIRRLADFHDAEEGHKAVNGDMLVIDFVGTIDGEEFQGGKADGLKLELGLKQFIPGFEEQLVGVIAGEQRKIKVTFPEDYSFHQGKEAEFDIKIHKILVNKAAWQWDDELAKRIGFDDIAKVDKIIGDRISADFSVMARLNVKKQLFDILDREYDFELPSQMLEVDLKQLIEERKSKIADKSTINEENLRNECMPIARRRVKIGLILAENARNNSIVVLENDMREAIAAQVMQRPDKQKEIIEYFSKAEHLKMLEGPILEEKTFDFLLTKITLNNSKITAQEFSTQFSI